MAWEDVPAKMARYIDIEYGGLDNAARLLAKFKADTVDEVPVQLRVEFEEQLDYRLGACENLVRSRAINPKRIVP